MKDNIIKGFNFSSLPIKINYVGKVDDKEWPNFLYNCTFTSKNGFFTIPFKCGLGRIHKVSKRPIYPTPADVMYSLLSDIQAEDMSFNSWCNEFGVDNDSMKQFKIYHTCCEYSVLIRKCFTPEQLEAMQTALEDY